MRRPASRRLGRAGFLPRPALKPYKERKRLGLDDRNLSGLLHPVSGRPARAGQRGTLGALRQLLAYLAAGACRGCTTARRSGSTPAGARGARRQAGAASRPLPAPAPPPRAPPPPPPAAGAAPPRPLPAGGGAPPAGGLMSGRGR